MNSRRSAIKRTVSQVVVALIAVTLAIGLTGLAFARVNAPTSRANAAFSTTSDWSSYLYSTSNASYNTSERQLSPANASSLTLVDTYNVGQTRPFSDAVATQVLVSSGILYFGSWNGNEYAVNAVTHQVIWQDFLGIDTAQGNQGCYPNGIGVTSSASIFGRTLYVGGADGNMYAIDTRAGKILWHSQIATPPNEYLWGAPLIANGRVYEGVASLADCPLIRGRLVMLNMINGAVMAIYYTIDSSNLGSSIWGKPVFDPTTGTIVVNTGNAETGSPPESEAVLQLNSFTLQPVKNGVWQVPQNQVGVDSDFGASCMALPNVGGGAGVICHNKNGTLYALKTGTSRAPGLTLSWSLKLGDGGDSPEFDYGDVESGSFDGHYVYYSTTHTWINGVSHPGAIYKVDPTNGKVIWVTPFASGFPVTATVGASGLMVVGLTQADPTQPGIVLVLSAASGVVLSNLPVSMGIYGAPTIADGHIFAPTFDGHIFSFSLPGNAVIRGTSNGG